MGRRGAGFSGFRGIDANIDALNYLAQPAQLGQLLDEAARIRQELESRTLLTRGEQLTYRYALRAVGLQRDSVARAIGILRDPERFYDYGSYRQATLVLKRWLDVLSLQGFPGQFGDFTLRINNVGNLCSLADLTSDDYIQRLTRPLQPYFESEFDAVLREQPWHLVGLSVNYIGQLPFAMRMAKQIRQALPNTLLCVGGTEISDELKCLRDRADIWKLFPECDAVVGGEGESVLMALLRSIANGKPLPDGQPVSWSAKARCQWRRCRSCTRTWPSCQRRGTTSSISVGTGHPNPCCCTRRPGAATGTSARSATTA